MSIPFLRRCTAKLSQWLPVLSIVSAVVALGVVKQDLAAQYRWVSFGYYIFSLVAVVLRFWLTQQVTLPAAVRALMPRKIGWWLVGVIGLAVVSRFWRLTSYPFVSVGDEVREVGLFALQVARGERRDIFGYGAYEAYGMIIPTISAGFYRLFGSTVFTYRLQTALLGLTDIFLVYLIAWLATKRQRIAVIANLILTTLPLHLYYSRTEVVVMYASTFTLLLLLVWYKVKSQLTSVNLMLLTTLLGFSFGLYAAVRTVALVILFLLLKELVWSRIRKPNVHISQSKKAQAKGMTLVREANFWQQILLVGLFLLVGFGPRLWFTNNHNFFHTSRLPLVGAQNESKVLTEIPGRYLKSLLVWYNQPTSSWYADHRPIVLPLFTLFLVLGVIAAIKNKNWYLLDLIFLLLVIHGTNSAITDMLNADHRLAPLYGVGALFMAIGVSTVADATVSQGLRRLLYLLVGGVCVLQLVGFFVNQSANKNKGMADYLSMHIIYELQQIHAHPSQVILEVSPANYAKLNTQHYKEQYQYFFPGANLIVNNQPMLADREVIVSTIPETATTETTHLIVCQTYTCPKGLESFAVTYRGIGAAGQSN